MSSTWAKLGDSEEGQGWFVRSADSLEKSVNNLFPPPPLDPGALRGLGPRC